MGCIYGSECAALAITTALARQRVPGGVHLWIVPEMNPDGTAADTSQDARGVDLNRNFPYRWQRTTSATYYSGPHALSEPASHAAVCLIQAIRPAVTIWYHQHENLADMASVDRGIARQYTRTARLRGTCLPFLPGTATSWLNDSFQGTTSFVVELPAGRVGAQALGRHLTALAGAEVGQRIGSRSGCTV